MSVPFSYYDLVEAFEKPGCAVCKLLLHDADRFLESVLYEYATDAGVNRAFRDGRGLCNEHSWRLARSKGGVLSIAILYEAAVDEVLSIIEDTPVESPNASWISRLKGVSGSVLADQLEPRRICIACEMVASAEKQYVQTVCDYIADERFVAAYQRSDGLCLPHFRQVLRAAKNPQPLILLQTAVWEKLQADLETFIDRYDFKRAGETMGDEGDSWLRAIARMAGEHGVFGPNRR